MLLYRKKDIFKLLLILIISIIVARSQNCTPKLYDLTKYGGRIFNVSRSGENCNIENPCQPQTANLYCLNNGTCKDKYCMCFQFPNGIGTFFNGPHCEIKNSNCQIASPNGISPCENSGECESVGKTININGYICKCKPGYSGLRCEIDIDECQSNPCIHGNCTNLVNSYSCKCNAGYAGYNCTENKNECMPNPCKNNGICEDMINSYRCNCAGTGYEGLNCDTNINECSSNPCGKFVKKCTDLVNGYKCECSSGFTGKNCEIDIKECSTDPCHVNSTCIEIPNGGGFQCMCSAGYTGNLCMDVIDECKGHKCSPNSACQNLIGSYKCICKAGFRGRFCDIDIDECAVNPCKNQGSCVNLLNDYSCKCPFPNSSGAYFGDKNCSKELIGCKNTNKCGSGTCIPYYDQAYDLYHCSCSRYFTGNNCDKSAIISFDGKTAWRTQGDGTAHNTGENGVKIEFYFQTTIVNQILLATNPGGSISINLVLVSENSIVAYFTRSSQQLLTVPLNIDTSLVNGSENFISFEINPRNVSFMLQNTSKTIKHNWNNIKMTDLTLGGERNCKDNCFIGCMSGVYITEPNKNAFKYFIETPQVRNTCPRKIQCSNSTCSGHGNCSDLWFKFKCHCNRPYLGEKCNLEGPAFTLYDNTDIVYQPTNISTAEDFMLTFYFRTIAKTIQLVSFIDNGVSFAFHLSSNTFKYNNRTIFKQDFSDGLLHLFTLFIKEEEMSIIVDDYKYSTTNLTTSIVHTLKKRRRRRRKRAVDEIRFRPTSGKISLKDIRVNQQPLLLSKNNINTNNISLDDGLQSIIMYPTQFTGRLDYGEITADRCSENVCQPNSTINCTNVFYDDYSCQCKNAWIGKNCQTNDYCFNDPCSSKNMGVCENRPDLGGFFCTANVTVVDEAIVYTFNDNLNDTNSNLIDELNFQFRSSNRPSTLFKIESLNNELSIKLLKNATVIYFRNSECLFNVSFSNGIWQNIKITFGNSAITLKSVNNHHHQHQFESSCTTINGKDILKSILTKDSRIIIGQNYTGCYGNMFVGNQLLSFFENSMQIGLASSFNLATTKQRQLNFGCRSPDICASSPCYRGVCKDEFYSYACQCNDGWEGVNCEKDVDECMLGVCQNGATCLNEVGSYKCVCVAGYKDKNCQTEINECEVFRNRTGEDACLNNSTCWDKINEFRCNCSNENITGDRCQYSEFSKCSQADICRNGSVCLDLSGRPGFQWKCNCSRGYEGRHCDEDINECLPVNPCTNKATCTNTAGSFICNCLAGYGGEFCEKNINECESNPCRNGAVCLDDVNKYTCNCTTGWKGTHCDMDINECNTTSSNLCNYGICINTPGNYTCNCTGSGYGGNNCNKDIDECDDLNFCKNNASCRNTIGSFNCTCKSGFIGLQCEKDIDECLPINNSPCKNNGICENLHGTFKCHCNDYYEGENCTLDINECIGNVKVCKNGATCHNSIGNYSCVCPRQYIGQNCESYDFCWNSSCSNNGSCQIVKNKPVCKCINEWSGPNCEDKNGETSKSTSSKSTAVIIGVVFGIICLILIIVIIIFIVVARRKRADKGVYSPSKQEVNGSRVHMNNVLKPPPEERLI